MSGLYNNSLGEQTKTIKRAAIRYRARFYLSIDFVNVCKQIFNISNFDPKKYFLNI